jgi:hypothetical protein
LIVAKSSTDEVIATQQTMLQGTAAGNIKKDKWFNTPLRSFLIF